MTTMYSAVVLGWPSPRGRSKDVGLCVGCDLKTSWLPLALESGTVVSATDGSYDRKKRPDVSGAGWVIACRRSGRVLKGSFFKFSSNASSYRGELLDLVAIHTLVLHTCRFYQPAMATGKIVCNSKLALYKSSKKDMEGSALA